MERSVANKKRAVVSNAKAQKQSKKAPEVDFAEEYKYVLGDLKKIGILAACLFGVLIVLTFIL